MNKFSIALLGAFALVAAPALSGCETSTEIEDDGTSGAVVVDDETVGMDTDLDMIDGDSVEAGFDDAGNAIGDAASDAGDAIDNAAGEVGDEIDEIDANVDTRVNNN